jgi:hypothetical protein
MSNKEHSMNAAAMTSIRVEYDNWVENLGGSSPDDRWSRDSTSTTWTVKGVSIGEDHNRLSLPGTVEQGDVVWLVYAVWSDGDSFGRDDGARIEFITVHRDEVIARANALVLSDVDEDAGYGQRVMLRLDDGTEMPYTIPWLGYFERLDYVRCERFVVGGEQSNTYLPHRLR